MRILCVKGPAKGQSFEIEDGLRFGREKGDEPFLLLRSSSVSRQHGEFFVSSDAAVGIRDLGSSNGIRVNRLRIKEAFLKSNDLVQVGEFTFRCVNEESEVSATNSEADHDSVHEAALSHSSSKPQNQLAGRVTSGVAALWQRFESLDFRMRALILFALMAMLIHGLIVLPLLSEAKTSLYSQAFQSASRAARNLGDRNKRELAEGSHFLLDCEFLKQAPGVRAAQLLDSQGKVVCPVGSAKPSDDLMEIALYQGDAADNCDYRILELGAETCDFVVPVREWRDDPGQYLTVGVARLTYEPSEARQSMQSLQALALKSFFFSMGLLGLLWVVLMVWIRKGVTQVTEGVSLAISGTVQSLAPPASFAAFEPLVQEMNRLLAKGNQSISSNVASGPSEASFLQALFQQVVLMEDRPVMVVDRDNHFLAGSEALAEIIPVNLEHPHAHITEVIGDSHLQGELMGLLNDLSQSSEVIERALSMSDRIVQVRGMPLFLNEEYVASLLML